MTAVIPDIDATPDADTRNEPSIPCESGWIWCWFRPLTFLNRFTSHPQERCDRPAVWDELYACPDGTTTTRSTCDVCHQQILIDQAGLSPCVLHGFRHERRMLTSVRRGGAR